MSKQQSYKNMLTDLEGIVQEVADSKLDLDVMVEKVSSGYELVKKLREKLSETKNKIDVLRTEFSGEEA